MLIGVPKEIKKQEERVGATPSAVASLVHAGHSVIVEKGAGVGSGFPDKEYKRIHRCWCKDRFSRRSMGHRNGHQS